MRGASLGSIYYLFLSFCLLFISGAWASTPSGVEWLKQQQRQDGAFYTDQTSSTEYQATIESLLALGDLESLSDTQRDSGVGFLLQPDLSSHSEFHSRMDLLAEQFGLTDTIDSGIVSERIAYNGGVGGYASHDGSVLNTALALNAWASGDSVSPDKLDRAITFLLSNQQADGGWSETPNFTNTYVTAITSQALQRYRFRYPVGASISAASEYLLANQSSDGWGSIVETALALQALIPVITDSTRYQTGLENLKVGQTENGSWGGDVFATALALRALYQVSTAPEPVDPSVGSIEGQVIDSNTRQPIESVVVTAQGDSSYSAKSGQDGRFRLTDMEPDDYSLSYQASGFQGVNQSGRVGAGQHLSVGTIEMSPLPDSGLISGVIRDAQGVPIPGAQVSLAGASAGQTVSDENGRYLLSSLPGGIQLAVSSEGYVTVTAAASVVAGSHLNFSPVLYLEGNPPPQDVSVQGKVVDSDTGEGLGNVFVEVIGVGKSAESKSDGSFLLQGLETGQKHLRLVKGSYETVTLSFASVVGANDLGKILLLKNSEATTLYGRVFDNETGHPLSGAKVSVGGMEVVSGENGGYRLEGLPELEFDVSVSHAGYLTKVSSLKAGSPGQINYDLMLDKASVDGVVIEDIGKDRLLYGAYEKALFDADLYNGGDRDVSLNLYAEVFDGSGSVVSEFSVPAGSVTIKSRDRVSREFDWNTSNYKAGDYTLLIKAVDDSDFRVLHESEIGFYIAESREIQSVGLAVYPDNAVAGETKEIGFAGKVYYRTNLGFEANLRLRVTSPDGQILVEKNKSFTLDEVGIVKDFDLGRELISFGGYGGYQVESDFWVDGNLVDESLKTIYVDPDFRIVPSISFSAEDLVPNEPMEVNVRLNLKAESE